MKVSKNMFTLCLLLGVVGYTPTGLGFSKKTPATVPGTYESYQDSTYDHSYNRNVEVTTGSTSGTMASIARAAAEGAGTLRGKYAHRVYCGRAVKQIIAAGLGKDFECIHKTLSSQGAKDLGKDLEELGFENRMNECNAQGAVRVYKGVHRAGVRWTSGDTWGHAEVVGEDGEYHSFYNNPEPIDKYMAGRRILTGCYVPNEAKIKAGPAAKCPASRKNGPSSGSVGGGT